MTATAVAISIVNRIDLGFSSGVVMLTPPTAWASWFNDYGFLVIVVFRDRNVLVMSRDDFDDMVIVWESQWGLRTEWVQNRGVFMVETMYSENEENDELQFILDEDFEGDDIRR